MSSHGEVKIYIPYTLWTTESNENLFYNLSISNANKNRSPGSDFFSYPKNTAILANAPGCCIFEGLLYDATQLREPQEKRQTTSTWICIHLMHI